MSVELLSTNLHCFITVARTLSISKAAAELFLTPQCVSDHIRRLEKSCEMPLFYRRPAFSLTPAGKVFFDTVVHLDHLNHNLNAALMEIKDGTRGILRFGIHQIRAYVLFPFLIAHYKKEFPNIELNIHFGETEELLDLLKKGKLDCILGIGAPAQEDFVAVPLLHDPIRVVVHHRLLQEIFGSSCNSTIKLLQQGADLRLLQDIPFIYTAASNRVAALITQFLNEKHICLNFTIMIPNFDLHLMLAKKIVGACFSPQMILHHTLSYNANCLPEEKLHVFPILNFDRMLNLEFIFLKGSYTPYYQLRFQELLKETIIRVANDF